MIYTRMDEEGEDYFLPLSSQEIESLTNETRTKLNDKKKRTQVKEDYKNWQSNRELRLLHIPALLNPSKAGRRRKNK